MKKNNRINSIHKTRMRNNAWFQFMTDFKKWVEKHLPEVLNVEALFAVFVTLYGKADEVLGLIEKMYASTEMKELDYRRDRIYVGFRSIVRSMKLDYDDAKRVAAEKVAMVFDQYGEVQEAYYADETSQIYNLLEELKSSKYHDSLVILRMEDWVPVLEQANLDFEATTGSRDEEISEKPEFSMKESRSETDNCYDEMIDRIEATLTLNPTPELEQAIKELNAIITRHKNALAHHLGVNTARNKREAEKAAADKIAADEAAEQEEINKLKDNVLKTGEADMEAKQKLQDAADEKRITGPLHEKAVEELKDAEENQAQSPIRDTDMASDKLNDDKSDLIDSPSKPKA